ncbi:MAG: hypothetical protein AAF481_01275 [Acidobacteriota bacterium]
MPPRAPRADDVAGAEVAEGCPGWAILSVLAGHVLPRPSRKVRWRMRLFDRLVVLQRRLQLAPRRPAPTLLELSNRGHTGHSEAA